MHKLVINKLGPIRHYELLCSQFMAFTGFQASGKSTITKAFYFFRTVKDDILKLSTKQALDTMQKSNVGIPSLKRELEAELREKFFRIFGSSWGMDNEMFMEYFFTDTISIKVSLHEEKNTLHQTIYGLS